MLWTLCGRRWNWLAAVRLCWLVEPWTRHWWLRGKTHRWEIHHSAFFWGAGLGLILIPTESTIQPRYSRYQTTYFSFLSAYRWARPLERKTWLHPPWLMCCMPGACIGSLPQRLLRFSLQRLPQQHEFSQVLEEEGRDNEGKLREIELLLDLTKERKDILEFHGFPWSLCILSQQFLFSSRAVDELGGFVIPSVFFQVEWLSGSQKGAIGAKEL